MEYFQHVVVQRQGRFHHATCLRCGLRAGTTNEALLQRVLQIHLCIRKKLSPAREEGDLPRGAFRKLPKT